MADGGSRGRHGVAGPAGLAQHARRQQPRPARAGRHARRRERVRGLQGGRDGVVDVSAADQQTGAGVEHVRDEPGRLVASAELQSLVDQGERLVVAALLMRLGEGVQGVGQQAHLVVVAADDADGLGEHLDRIVQGAEASEQAALLHERVRPARGILGLLAEIGRVRPRSHGVAVLLGRLQRLRQQRGGEGARGRLDADLALLAEHLVQRVHRLRGEPGGEHRTALAETDVHARQFGAAAALRGDPVAADRRRGRTDILVQHRREQEGLRDDHVVHADRDRDPRRLVGGRGARGELLDDTVQPGTGHQGAHASAVVDRGIGQQRVDDPDGAGRVVGGRERVRLEQRHPSARHASPAYANRAAASRPAPARRRDRPPRAGRSRPSTADPPARRSDPPPGRRARPARAGATRPGRRRTARVRAAPPVPPARPGPPPAGWRAGPRARRTPRRCGRTR
ncbi:hypothetical protein [Microbacterium hominis]|uniref:hypothetical protein n=1 Tax=Microbacterium hominis TaxID=162426 RepID=UPI00076877F3|nr:hypothetical protein [Microbacterium hominis]KXC06466.1 hypothetical protein MhomT_05485 [Microbacterium hominis]